jgi:hypothetical protein
MKMRIHLTWKTPKAVSEGKYIPMNAHIRRLARSRINNPMLYLKLLEKQEQPNPKSNIWKEIIKIRAEINGLETKRTLQ